MSILSRIWHKIEDLFISHHHAEDDDEPDRPTVGPNPLDNASPMEVAAALTKRAKEIGGNLDPLHSIVDFLKVLGEPSTLEARAELAGDLGLGNTFTGRASDNDWLMAELRKRLGEPQNRWRLDNLER